MASLFGRLPPNVRLLDAGAGAGALTEAFVLRACSGQDGVKAIDATLYEIDSAIQAKLSRTMERCQTMCSRGGIKFSFAIHASDFIEEASTLLAQELFHRRVAVFDAAIVNPPYRKINAQSRERSFLRRAGIETTNLYTGFISLIHRLLAPGGELVAITPRSFCNGTYFRGFREDLLNHLEIHRLHIFDSRSAAFARDNVLQENVVFHAVKGRRQPPKVTISASSGTGSGDMLEARTCFGEIVHAKDPEIFIHIPSAATHTQSKEVMDGLDASLASLKISVSTGAVVDFRLKTFLRQDSQEGTVPLIYPCHFNGGLVHWPKAGSRKPNAILDNDETRSWLAPSGLYLLTKRFTSKEERRRLVACLFDPAVVRSKRVGFENHLNYFHSNGGGLDRDLAFGLFAFLNSTVVDQYFRRFSGHTQVNATDLRNLAYPDRSTLEAIGRRIENPNLSQEEIDALVEKYISCPQTSRSA